MYAFIKRSLDLAFSIAGLLCLSPLFLVIALMIKLDSRGPVFYKGVRVGRNSVVFNMFKFRTMVENAQNIGGTSTAENDSRITKVGNFLRRSKFDELPQLINVLKGEMSIVGPRPEVEEYTSIYNDEEMEILSVLPGITDYASIEFRNLNRILAKSNDPDEFYRDVIRPQKNILRLKYVQNKGLIVDFKIVLQTIKVVIMDFV